MPVVSRFSPRSVGIGAAVVTVFVWTAFIVIARASTAHSLAPFDIATARMCGASLVLAPWGAWLVRKAQRESGGAPVSRSMFGLSPLGLRVTAAGGVFAGIGYALLAYSGFFYAPAAHASVLLPGSLPLWTTLLAALVLRDRITPMRAAGLSLIVVGDLLVGGSSLLHAFDGGEIWKGDLMFMSAAFCWACYSVLVRRDRLDAVRATIAITVFSVLTFVPVYLLLAMGGLVISRLGTAPLSEIAFQMLFQGGGSVVISGITFTRMVQYFGPVRSSMVTALVPGLSAFAAVALLDEPLHWNLLAGLLLVTAGILFGVQRVRPGAATAVAPAAGIAERVDA
jgi:drug/metabolite transporter (DMT)-like permease